MELYQEKGEREESLREQEQRMVDKVKVSRARDILVTSGVLT